MSTDDEIDFRKLLEKSYFEISRLKSDLKKYSSKNAEPIAITGVACRFPGNVTDTESYWQLLVDGVDAVSEIPDNRWPADELFDTDKSADGKIYTKYGAFLDNIENFDPLVFGISPREAEGLDPQQRLLLETAWESLESSCAPIDSYKNSKTGVFVGMSTDDYLRLSVKSPDAAIFNSHVALGTTRSIAAGRISHTFGFHGPAIQVDTSCSSSMVALHLGIQSLRQGETNTALVGAVNLMLTPDATIGLCRLNALSPSGRCQTFDSDADGYVRGEGCAMVVLKRMSDAVDAGDNILAVIVDSAINHDGQSNGLTAPNGPMQEALISETLSKSRVDSSDIQYVETHGTGTPLGDPIEVQALSNVLGRNRTKDNPLLLGAVKTNIGHLESAAGMASLIKTLLCLQNQAIPPNLHFNKPNPYIAWDQSFLKVPTKTTPWPRDKNRRRLAGVSSFGFSGTNAHVILEEAPQTAALTSEVER
ncbi:MAG: polyketide synthase, partial [Gammaproteobacteria bacterium]|nr:polyketide synthase [Gammaproteobacteria bacterium]